LALPPTSPPWPGRRAAHPNRGPRWGPAITFSAAAGAGTDDTRLQVTVTTLTASADTAEQQFFDNTVSGSAVDSASVQETLAEAAATANPSAPLTRNAGLDAATWYGNISTTIDDTRQVADQAAGQITARANALNSNAARRLLLTSIITLLLVLLTVTALARPLRKLVNQTGRRPVILGKGMWR
jgi:hypothetical protein